MDTWKGLIHKDNRDIVFENNAAKLYFEEDSIDAFVEKLEGVQGINFVHSLIEHSWGQRVVRFYDFDNHIMSQLENWKPLKIDLLKHVKRVSPHTVE